ncbi:MAG: glycosyl hydrolase repeat-containing protein, partial [Acidobacteria bacterium]|nr:glycosyl hydrolase repeat-containing protein [Acidobacteriota bacterium]
MRRPVIILALIVSSLALLAGLRAQAAGTQAQPKADRDAKAAAPVAGLTSSTVDGLRFRSIGPAVTSGRVIDIAVSPADKRTWYVASVGGLWKTENAGTSWKPIFDDQGSFSIGCVTVDPEDPNIVWVGSGENNSQRSVSYGDGVYR